MRVNSATGLTGLQRWMLQWKRRLRARAVVDLSVALPEGELSFRCRSAIEENRVAGLLSKEPGTIRWLRESLSPGDVFVDVGANIGIYSLFAAKLVGPSGKVYAFEPHAANFESLLHNIGANQLIGSCFPLSSALSDRSAYLPFFYASPASGSSMSQLGRPDNPCGDDLSNKLAEIKHATSLNELIVAEVIERPNHIKIDVDGIEADIIRGMCGLLESESRPDSVQVEVQPDTNVAVVELMTGSGYTLSHRHHTAIGQARLDRGTPEVEITHNIVFLK